MQYCRIAFSTLNSNAKYSCVILFVSFSVHQPPLSVIYDEHNCSTLFIFINKHLFVCRQFTLLSKSTRDRVASFLSTYFSSRFFSCFFFTNLYELTSSRKRSIFYSIAQNIHSKSFRSLKNHVSLQSLEPTYPEPRSLSVLTVPLQLTVALSKAMTWTESPPSQPPPLLPCRPVPHSPDSARLLSFRSTVQQTLWFLRWQYAWNLYHKRDPHGVLEKHLTISASFVSPGSKKVRLGFLRYPLLSCLIRISLSVNDKKNGTQKYKLLRW